MTLFWQIYYDTLWQALSTIGIHGICSLLLLILLIHTSIQFTSSKFINPYKQQRIQTRSNVSLPPRLSLYSNSSNRTSTIESKNTHSLSISSSSSSKSIPISPTIKILTICYLFFMFLYSAISFILRNRMWS